MFHKSKKILIIFLMILLAGLIACNFLAIGTEDDEPQETAALEIRDILFGQLDWYRLDGSLAQGNSLYGWMSWSYDPDPSTTYYLNILVSLQPKGEGSWVIQNLPLFAVDNEDFSNQREAVYFNLAEIGVDPGTDLSQIYYALAVDDVIRTTPPGPAETLADVETLDRVAGDSADETPERELFTDPGAPTGVKLDGVPERLNTTRDVRGVQEGYARCSVGSFARSIDWLNRKHSLGMNKNAQQIYDDLLAAGVSKPNDDGSTARDEWVAIKDQYVRAQTGNRIVTKVWDSGTTVDPIDGVTEESGDFLEWLKREIATEDVEVAYKYPGNAHIVTVLQVYVRGEKTFVKYRDDEAQGNDSAGDEAVKHAEVYKKGSKYHFGSDRNTIYFAVSESVVPAATPTPTSGTVLEPTPTPTPTVEPKDWQVFAVLLTGDYVHFQGYSEVEGDVVVLGKDPEPMPGATVTVRMTSPDGSVESMSTTTGADGVASFTFTIYVYGDYTVTIENIEGEDMVYDPGRNIATSVVVRVSAAESTTTKSAVGIEVFYEQFNAYFQAQDVDGLVSLLHEDVIDLYGVEACQAYLGEMVENPVSVEVLAVKEFGTWNWEIDEISTMVEYGYTIVGNITSANQTNRRDFHLGLRNDASLGWYTDCGDSLP